MDTISDMQAHFTTMCLALIRSGIADAEVILGNCNAHSAHGSACEADHVSVLREGCSPAAYSIFDMPPLCFDTRRLVAGDIFIALPGNCVDGHDFLDEAIARGASGLIVARQKIAAYGQRATVQQAPLPIFVVEDTQQTLFAIARAKRAAFSGEVVGITGSVGKTTTKEMVRSILACAGISACVSDGNENTLLSAARTLSRLQRADTVCVLEMGIHHPGDMKELAALVQPTIAVITAIAPSHMQYLGGLDQIAQEKWQIVTSSGCVHTVILPDGQAELRPYAEASSLRKLFFETNPVSTETLALATAHAGHRTSASAARVIAGELGVSRDGIQEGLDQWRPYPGRFQLCSIQQERGQLIDDAYNANPLSMRIALETFDALAHRGAKIAVLGDMLELGEMAHELHRVVGHCLAHARTITRVIFVGTIIASQRAACAQLQVQCVQNWHEALALLEPLLRADVLVLLKGSRGVGLQNIARALCG